MSDRTENISHSSGGEPDPLGYTVVRPAIYAEFSRQGDLKFAHRRCTLRHSRSLEPVMNRPLVDAVLAGNLGSFHPGLVVRDAGSVDFGAQPLRSRSEERRVGKEWVSTCRSRGSPFT